MCSNKNLLFFVFFLLLHCVFFPKNIWLSFFFKMNPERLLTWILMWVCTCKWMLSFFRKKIFWKNKRLFICIVRLLKDPNVCWILTEQLQVLLQYLSSSSCKGCLRFTSSYCILALNALRWTKCLGWVRSELGELCEGYSMECVFNYNLLPEFSGLIFFIMWGDIYCAFFFNQVGKLWIF